jgi:serine/threonine protein kinase
MPAIAELAASDWHRLNRLLEAALALDPDARETWLQAAAGTEADLLPLLRRLLAGGASIETDAFAGQPPMSAEAPAGEQPGDVFGPYRLQHVLGEGGMGTVWLAERADGAFERAVALKLPRAEWTDQGLAQRFARERAVLASLNHPNIAQLFDAGWSASGRPYLALEYVEGVPITEWCDTRRLGVAARLGLFVDVIRAVAYAHSRLVVHRDLKPSNVLVTEAGDVKLLDFGIAKLLADDGSAAAETELTRIGGRALTLQYAAPEQILGKPVTTAADVYALGVLLFELLSGERPYRLSREDLQRRSALEDAVLHADAPAPSSVATDLTARRSLRGDPDAMVLRALHKSPEHRYETAAAFADDIERHLAKLPVRAQRAGPLYRISRYVARHRLAVGAISAVMVALTAGLSAALWQARVASDEAARATLIKDFVLSIIQQADPVASRQTRESDLALLVTAESRVEQALGRRPELALQMRRAIGSAYYNRGAFDRARSVLRHGIEQARSALPANHPELLGAFVQMGEELLIDSARAREDLKQAIPHLRAMGPAGRLLLADALLSRHRQLRWRGNWREVLNSSNESWDAARATGDAGRMLDVAAEVVHTGAMSRQIMERGKHMMAEALSAAQGRIQPSDPRWIVASVYDSLTICGPGERKEESLERARQAVAAARKHHGPDARVTEQVLGVQGFVHRCANDHRGALPLIREAYEISVRRDEPKSTNRDLRRGWLVEVLLALGQRDEIESLLRETPIDRGSEVTPRVNDNWWEARVRLRLGHTEEAERIAEAGIALLQEEGALPTAGRLFQVLSQALHENGKSERAEAFALISLDLHERDLAAFEPTPAQVGDNLLMLGEIRRAGGRHALALGDADRALGAFSKDGEATKGQRIAVDALRGRALLGLERPQEALPLLAAAHEFERARSGTALFTARRAWWHAQALLATGHRAAGEALQREASATLATSPMPRDRALATATQRRSDGAPIAGAP